MVVGDGESHRRPLAAAKGEPQLPGVGIEVETRPRNSNERGADVGNAGEDPPAEAFAMPGREAEGDLRGGHPDRTGDAQLKGTGASESRELPSGRHVRGNRLAEAEVHQESKVALEFPDLDG